MRRPTILVDQYRKAATIPAGENAYRGLRIHALPGLHDFVGARAVQYFAPGASVLDLAAGSGAMCQRLHDLGMHPEAVDYVAENFKAESFPLTQADLNEDLKPQLVGRFDGLVASEIIEHLENPRHFARQCFRALRAGGRMVLTTPNLENPGSMAEFVRSGEFLWFSDRDYTTQGHITPLTQSQIRKAFEEAGFGLLWAGSFGKGASRSAGSPLLKILARCLSAASRIPAARAGEIFVAVLERPA